MRLDMCSILKDVVRVTQYSILQQLQLDFWVEEPLRVQRQLLIADLHVTTGSHLGLPGCEKALMQNLTSSSWCILTPQVAKHMVKHCSVLRQAKACTLGQLSRMQIDGIPSPLPPGGPPSLSLSLSLFLSVCLSPSLSAPPSLPRHTHTPRLRAAIHGTQM